MPLRNESWSSPAGIEVKTIRGSAGGVFVKRATPGIYLVHNSREISDTFGNQETRRAWSAGEIGFVPPGTVGEIEYAGGEVFLTHVHIPDRYVRVGAPGPVNWRVSRGIRDEAIVQMIRTILELGPGADRMSLGGVAVAMVSRVRSWFSRPTDNQAARVANLILSSLVDPPSVREMAAHVELSESHFLRMFKQHFGITPAAYIAHARFERARHLLINTEMTLASIAAACGYSSQSHMTGDFKKRVGLPPRQYLMACRAG
jgi:AraC family transcriptional regulator